MKLKCVKCEVEKEISKELAYYELNDEQKEYVKKTTLEYLRAAGYYVNEDTDTVSWENADDYFRACHAGNHPDHGDRRAKNPGLGCDFDGSTRSSSGRLGWPFHSFRRGSLLQGSSGLGSQHSAGWYQRSTRGDVGLSGVPFCQGQALCIPVGSRN